MNGVRRVYVEKKPEFAVQAKELNQEIKSYLGIRTVENVRVLNRYDVENLSDETFERACNGIFAEPPVDTLYLEEFPAAEGSSVFSVEYLPGQFDQRADSAVQCVQFIKEDEQPVIKTATTYVIEGKITAEELAAIKDHCINPVDSRETGCVQFIKEDEQPVIKTATTYVIEGKITAEELAAIKDHCINPVDSRETGMEKPETLVTVYDEPKDVKIFDGFKDMPEKELKELYSSLGLAMTFKDFQHIQGYFKSEEDRDPSMTEIRVLDTYWSDHCRHTTFSTELTDVSFGEGDYKTPIEDTYRRYLADHSEIFKGREDKFVCLMDLALMAMRKLKKEGKLEDQEESEEINACSIVVPVEVDGVEEEWLVNFKNETHNHPTEIEPFGGAATCLGGAIRDPLSGRTYVYQAMRVTGAADPTVSVKETLKGKLPFGGAATCLGGAIRDPLSGRTYVYQAMRVTGAADPTVSVKETLKGKLPQKKLVRGAAHGYSSYGNQIGLATGMVKEIYHPDYVAKRMEIGAVMGAAPRRAVIRETSDPGDIIILLGGRTGRDGCGGATGSSKVHTEESIETAAPRRAVIRETSDPGDIIILLGGRTGRDGCGGATGSSKVHTEESIETCGAEVQKGNAPTERKIQRMFRREEVSRLIKKCNDFGAGGVSVAIGELAAGLKVDLDKVPKKYAGLDGTEIAISESQERMAVVVDPKDVAEFLGYAKEENLEAVEVAVVTEEPRLVLNWRGKDIVNISRAFLDTNGAHQETKVEVEIPNRDNCPLVKSDIADVKAKWLETLSDLNVCSQKGLVEMFDGSIGAGSVFMPHGGKYQQTETQSMVAKLPVLTGKCDTVTMMSFGFDPYLSSWSPYHGAVYAVTESIAKIVANGGDFSKIRFTFQEYFRRMTEDPKRWSQPFAALLGAYDAQLGFGLPSIGGKDSMSGTFQDIDVPPTLVSFAVDVAKEKDIITPELKKAGNKLVWLRIEKNDYDLPVYASVMEQYAKFRSDIQAGNIVSAYALDRHGVIPAVSKMAFGNGFGVKIERDMDACELFAPAFGDIVAEVAYALDRHGVIPAVSKMAFGNGFGVKIERDMDACELFAPAFGDIVAEVPAECVEKLAITYTVIGEVLAEPKFTYAGRMCRKTCNYIHCNW